MMDKSKQMIDVDALGQATDTTFGRSSTVPTATFSVKARQVSENRLQVDYLSILTYAGESGIQAAKKKYDSESESAINGTMKKIKEEYKNISGKALKAKQISSDESVEPVAISSFSAVRRAYYRRRIVYQLG